MTGIDSDEVPNNGVVPTLREKLAPFGTGWLLNEIYGCAMKRQKIKIRRNRHKKSSLSPLPVRICP